MGGISLRLPQALAKDKQEAKLNVFDARRSNIMHDISRQEAADWKEKAKVLFLFLFWHPPRTSRRLERMEPMSEAATTEYSPLSRAAMERIISTTLPAAEAIPLMKSTTS